MKFLPAGRGFLYEHFFLVLYRLRAIVLTQNPGIS